VKKIGNIISGKKLVVWDRFNVVPSLSECVSDVPTLVIGYKESRELFPDTELIFKNRKINENTFWTFSKRENVRDYETDLDEFMNNCYKRLQSKPIYFFVDTVHFSEAKIARTFEKIKSVDNLIGYIHNNRMIYLYGDGIIFGIDLELSKFIGNDPNKVISRFEKLTDGLITPKDLPSYFQEDLIKLDNAVKYIPYLWFLDELNNNS
jgi:hypothetical protein